MERRAVAEPVRRGAEIAALAVIYFAAARLGLRLAFVAEQVTVVWPPTGLALGAVLLLGPRVWPGIALGAFAANVAAHASVASAGIAAGNTLEAVIAAALLRRAGVRRELDRLRDVLWFIAFAAVGSTAISATVGVTSLCAAGIDPWARFGTLWWVWWLGDAMANLVLAPLLLVWAALGPAGLRGRTVEASILTVSAVLLSALAFGAPGIEPFRRFPLHYALFPLVVVAALRFRQLGTTTVTFVIATVAIWQTATALGPDALPVVHRSLILFQLYLAIVASTGLLLGAAIAERDSAQALVAAELADLDASMRERRRLEAELKRRLGDLAESDRRKDEFLAMLAHELRNPLAALAASLEVAGRDASAREASLAIASRQVGHLARLVDDLLDVSRITSGRVLLAKRPVAVADVVERAVEMARPLLDGRHTLTVSVPAQPVLVDADAVRLVQVVGNLLNNAANFTPPGGSIALVVERRGEEASVRVSDTGVGIAPELLPRVFDLFVQGDVSLDRTRGGLGIGLTLVRALVELHGGCVEARSEGPGKGSEFEVRLPILRETPAADSAAPLASPPPAPRRLRILVVEDDADAADSLQTLLVLWGHAVRVASDGSDALETAETFTPDVVVSDVGLPGMDGYELARRLRRRAQSTVLVALSGYGRDEDKRRAFEAGYDHHLVKPATADMLAAVLVRASGARD